jgi:hypothetical protein
VTRNEQPNNRRDSFPASQIVRMIQRIAPLLLVAATLSATAQAFTVTPQGMMALHRTAPSTSSLFDVIRAAELDNAVDEGEGGVRLAMESAIKIIGVVEHKPGSANPKPSQLLRYTQVQQVSEDQLKAAPIRIVCTGIGKELYKDPGETTIKEVTYAPLDAVRDALNAAGSTQDAEMLVINFLGGDDLQMMEVLEAVEELVLDLDAKTNAKISFNSLCHKMFPEEKATLTVAALTSGKDGETPLRGVAKSLAAGEVYFHDGMYYTVTEEDINDALE